MKWTQTATLAMLWICGCTIVQEASDWVPGTSASTSDGGVAEQGGNGSSGGSSSGAVGNASGLPCDIQAIVASQCASCHGATPNGAPNSLVTLAQFKAPSPADPSKSEGQLSLERMKNAAKPMPPTGVPAAATVATFEAWVSGGMPGGTCGAADAGALEGGSSPYNTPTVCTSNQRWTRGSQGSALMHPGIACINCHKTAAGSPAYTIAGTLYPTVHEPNDCNGVTAGTISVTDAANKTTTIAANEVGNFMTNQAFKFPVKVKVISGGKERVMAGAVSNGDCNTCHNEKGTQSAPGRVFLP